MYAKTIPDTTIITNAKEEDKEYSCSSIYTAAAMLLRFFRFLQSSSLLFLEVAVYGDSMRLYG